MLRGGVKRVKKKVVVIEDDRKNMKLFEAILLKIPNLTLIKEVDGKRGLELIKTESPDLIILDIRLPNLNGIEICKEVRKLNRFKEIPIIAITAYAMKGDEKRILKAGFTKYLSKPLNVKGFRKIIFELLEP
jgi:CheY-like chemotaxis protein